MNHKAQDIILIPTDYRMKLTEELAEKGNTDAMINVYREYYSRLRAGEYVHENEQMLMVKYITSLAKNGNKDAALDLGNLYYFGLGVEQSYAKAVKWYTHASEMTDCKALSNLGYCYYYGRDVDIDYAKSYDCFSKSAFMGYYNAMYKLGDMFLNGYHVKKDLDAAFYWFNEAEKYCKDYEGQPSVDYRLGICHLHGYGTGIDVLEALRYLYKAELTLHEQISKDIPFAEYTLLKVREEIDKARVMLYVDKLLQQKLAEAKSIADNPDEWTSADELFKEWDSWDAAKL